ncbi:MAG: tRNA (N6-threonylcarbamoyladenosine(37)-N6)-methyltransferase TrmO [Planctomycetota bacterium]
MPAPEDIDTHAPAGGRPVIEDPEQLPDWTFTPVGVVHSPYRNHFQTPRQPGTGPDAADAWIILRRGMQNTLKDLRGFDYAWIVFVFNYSRGARQQVIPPRDSIARGVFATRSPHRPNPIGLSCVRVLNTRGTRILIRDHDLLHGTPVLDIKPYLPYADAHPGARAGYVDQLPPDAPDHRWD